MPGKPLAALLNIQPPTLPASDVTRLSRSLSQTASQFLGLVAILISLQKKPIVPNISLGEILSSKKTFILNQKLLNQALEIQWLCLPTWNIEFIKSLSFDKLHSTCVGKILPRWFGTFLDPCFHPLLGEREGTYKVHTKRFWSLLNILWILRIYYYQELYTKISQKIKASNQTLEPDETKVWGLC